MSFALRTADNVPRAAPRVIGSGEFRANIAPTKYSATFDVTPVLQVWGHEVSFEMPVPIPVVSVSLRETERGIRAPDRAKVGAGEFRLCADFLNRTATKEPVIVTARRVQPLTRRERCRISGQQRKRDIQTRTRHRRR